MTGETSQPKPTETSINFTELSVLRSTLDAQRNELDRAETSRTQAWNTVKETDCAYTERVTAIGSLMLERTEQGELSGDELIDTFSKFVLQTGSEKAIKELGATKNMRSQLAPGALVYFKDRISDKVQSIYTDEKLTVQPHLLTRRDNPRSGESIVLAFKVPFETPEGLTTIPVCAHTHVVGISAIKQELQEDSEFIERQNGEQRMLSFAELSHNYALIGEPELAKKAQQQALDVALNLVQKHMYDSSETYTFSKALRYVAEHGSEEFRNIYDQYAVKMASYPLHYDPSEMFSFITAFMPMPQDEPRAIYNQRFLKELERLNARGIELLRQQTGK